MIASGGHAKQKTEAGREFLEWASLFSGAIFVKIVVYADESGTHSPTGSQPGSEVPVIAGYMATPSDWLTFLDDWNSVLNLTKYNVDYFHHRELTYKLKSFRGWDKNKSDNFLFDLAEIAGRQIPIGGAYNLEWHSNTKKGDKKYPYSYVFETFFDDLIEAVNEHFPSLTGDIDLFFDQKKGDTEWESSLLSVAKKYRETKDNRIGAIAFPDKKKRPHWPLQAADLYAFEFRRLAKAGLRTFREASTGMIIGHGFEKQNPDLLMTILMRNVNVGPFVITTTPKWWKEFNEFSKKFPSVMRALEEPPKTEKP
jgi:hypothetical protein